MGKRNFTGYRDDSRNSFVGNGKLDSLLIASLDDSDKGVIFINSDLGQLAGEDARKHIDKQTITVDADGGTSAVLVTLKRYVKDETGTALASGVTVTIGDTDYTTASGGVISHTFDGATYTTVQALLDAINELDGFKAEIGNVLSSHGLDSENFVDMAETTIPFIGFDGLEAVYRDTSADNIAYLRLGLPTRKDRDPIQLIGVRGKITLVAGGAVTLYRDDQDEYESDGSHLEEYDAWTPAADDTLEEFVNDNVLEAVDLRGPLVLKVAATAIAGCDFKIKYRQALV